MRNKDQQFVANFAIYDDENHTVTLKSIPY